MTPRTPADDYRGAWNHARFRAECQDHGIGSGAELCRQLNAWLAGAEVPASMRPSQRTVDRVWSGETDPTTAGGSKGSRSMLLDLADFLEVNPSWLLVEAARLGYPGAHALWPAQYRAARNQLERLMDRQRAELAAAAPPPPRGELT